MLPPSTASTKAMLVQPAASISNAAYPGLVTNSAKALYVYGRLTTSATANKISVSQMPDSPCVSSSRIGYQMTPHMLAPMSRLVTGFRGKARLDGKVQFPYNFCDEFPTREPATLSLRAACRTHKGHHAASQQVAHQDVHGRAAACRTAVRFGSADEKPQGAVELPNDQGHARAARGHRPLGHAPLQARQDQARPRAPRATGRRHARGVVLHRPGGRGPQGARRPAVGDLTQSVLQNLRRRGATRRRALV